MREPRDHRRRPRPKEGLERRSGRERPDRPPASVVTAFATSLLPALRCEIELPHVDVTWPPRCDVRHAVGAGYRHKPGTWAAIGKPSEQRERVDEVLRQLRMRGSAAPGKEHELRVGSDDRAPLHGFEPSIVVTGHDHPVAGRDCRYPDLIRHPGEPFLSASPNFDGGCPQDVGEPWSVQILVKVDDHVQRTDS